MNNLILSLWKRSGVGRVVGRDGEHDAGSLLMAPSVRPLLAVDLDEDRELDVVLLLRLPPVCSVFQNRSCSIRPLRFSCCRPKFSCFGYA